VNKGGKFPPPNQSQAEGKPYYRKTLFLPHGKKTRKERVSGGTPFLNFFPPRERTQFAPIQRETKKTSVRVPPSWGGGKKVPTIDGSNSFRSHSAKGGGERGRKNAEKPPKT